MRVYLFLSLLLISRIELHAQINCSNWLKVVDRNDVVRIGDLDVSGDKITVEAMFNRTMPLGIDLSGGDLVSKHQGAQDCNYLLRANQAEITTTSGYYGAAADCGLELNKTFHCALVYDGATLKFYRNGFLMKSTPATGNLILNDWQTTIGDYAASPPGAQENMTGYINEVRIWNVARTQQELRDHMNTSLANPNSQTGLLAYYTFDNLQNKQGDIQWDGVLGGNALINETNPTCSDFLADSCSIPPVDPIIASFLLPDTICTNTAISIQNTTIGNGNFKWSFCSASMKSTTPSVQNLGNTGGVLSKPTSIDIIKSGNNFYGFLLNADATLARLEFGNDLSNIPAIINLGNLSGSLPTGGERMQILYNKGNWYGIFITSDIHTGSATGIYKIDFGNDIQNTNPVITSWGNLGSLDHPTGLYIVQDNNEWIGFVVNTATNSMTRFEFGENFDNPPIGINIGGSSELSYPSAFHAIKHNNNWTAFVTNSGGSPPGSSSFLSRLDFGGSLLNAPTILNLGNPSNLIHQPTDIKISSSCDEIIGFVSNGPSNNDVIKLDFNNSPQNIPIITSMGSTGSLNHPYSFSNFVWTAGSIYTFIPNFSNNTLTRIHFNSCDNASISTYNGKHPTEIFYKSPGTFFITLKVNEGFPNESFFCKSVVVLPNIDFSFMQEVCDPSVVNFSSAEPLLNNFQWSFGDGTLNTIELSPQYTYKNYGSYEIELKEEGYCPAKKVIDIDMKIDDIIITPDTTICDQTSKTLRTKKSLAFCWYPVDHLDDPYIPNPITSTPNNITYFFNAVITGDNLLNNTVFTGGASTYPYPTIWQETISVTPNTNYAFSLTSIATWLPNNADLYFVINNREVGNIPTPTGNNTTSYVLWNSGSNTKAFIAIINNNATNNFILEDISFASAFFKTDSVIINVDPLVNTTEDTLICRKSSIQLNTTGAMTYTWTPDIALSNSNIANPIASPENTTKYIVTGTTQFGCVSKDSVTITIKPNPVVSISADTTLCYNSTTQLMATGGISYQWSPELGLDNPFSANPRTKNNHSLLFRVKVTGDNDCTTEDSVRVTILPYPSFASSADQIICGPQQIQLRASGGDNYLWSQGSLFDDPTNEQQVVYPQKTTTYTVNISENLCSFDTTINTTITVLSEAFLNSLPNAFTPNNDGKNDCFGIRHWGSEKVEYFAVYNRWGQIVFETKDPTQCWDGNFKGVPQDSGGYAYIIKATTVCGPITKKGLVMLIR